MTHSFWLEQTVSVSRWLDASTRIGATSLDRSPGVFTRGGADGAQYGRGKLANVLVLLTKFTSV